MNKLYKAALAVVLPVGLILTGCSTPTPEPEPVKTVEESQDAAPIPTFDEPFTYPDGVSVTIGSPEPFTPSDTAVGVVEGQAIIQFTITLVNNSTEEVQIAGWPTVTSGNVEASAISDLEAGVDDYPTTPIQPGESASWFEAYSVGDATDVTISFKPNSWYDEFTVSTKG